MGHEEVWTGYDARARVARRGRAKAAAVQRRGDCRRRKGTACYLWSSFSSPVSI
jgi:hypothetical protein